MKKLPLWLILLLIITFGVALFGLTRLRNSRSVIEPEPTVESTPTAGLTAFSDGRMVFSNQDEIPDTDIETVLADLYELEQMNLAYLRKPGWLHLIKRTWTKEDESLQEAQENALWDISDMFPPIQINERWIQIIDSEGTMGAASLMVNSDDAGNPVQVLVTDTEGHGGNLTLIERDLEEYLETPPEIAAELDARASKQIGSDLRHTIEWLEPFSDNAIKPEFQSGIIRNEGNDVYFLRVQTRVLGKPHDDRMISEPITGYILTYRIDTLTGELLEMTNTSIGESGAEYLTLTKNLLVSEILNEIPVDVQTRWNAYMDEYWILVNDQET